MLEDNSRTTTKKSHYSYGRYDLNTEIPSGLNYKEITEKILDVLSG